MTVVPLRPLPAADWVELLRAQVAAASLSAVADRIGLSRTTVSLVLAGKYPAKTDLVARKVLDTFAARHCPPLNTAITGDACQRYRDRPMPRSSARDLRHWRACQTCVHNPHTQPCSEPRDEN